MTHDDIPSVYMVNTADQAIKVVKQEAVPQNGLVTVIHVPLTGLIDAAYLTKVFCEFSCKDDVYHADFPVALILQATSSAETQFTDDAHTLLAEWGTNSKHLLTKPLNPQDLIQEGNC